MASAPAADYQHEDGRSNAVEIADTQVRHNRANKVEDQAKPRRDPNGGHQIPTTSPNSPPNSQAARSGKKLQRYAYRFVDHSHLKQSNYSHFAGVENRRSPLFLQAGPFALQVGAYPDDNLSCWASNLQSRTRF